MQPRGLLGYQVQIEESDLMIFTECDLSRLAHKWLHHYRLEIENYAAEHPGWVGTLRPYPAEDTAPGIIKHMAAAAATTDVGPMAAVAGAVAQAVGRRLVPHSSEIVVENGGDIYLYGESPRNVLIKAGQSPYSGRLAIQVCPKGELSVCTSSGTSGHAKSFGRADAAVAIGLDAALADAAATALGNRVQTAADISTALAWAGQIPGLTGCLLIIGDCLGAWGDIELVDVKGGAK